MLKLILVALAVAAVASVDLNMNARWAVFKAKHNKQYTPVMEKIRKAIWMESTKAVDEHNRKYSQGLTTYYMGENKFSDMTAEEFTTRYNGLRGMKPTNEFAAYESNVATSSLPDTVDWVKKGAVTAVKDQGQCGSCWSFSATGSMEGQHFLKTGDLVSLAESNLLDCVYTSGDRCILGGAMDDAFKYVISNKGIDTEKSYPYEAHQRRCHFRKSDVGATLSSFKDVPSGSESALQEAVATIGPISVAIDANHTQFMRYQGGVYDNPDCSSTQLDHGVLAVGYGTLDGKDYWLVKNSWNAEWGMNGYVMMSRNKNNQCGIASAASYPIV